MTLFYEKESVSSLCLAIFAYVLVTTAYVLGTLKGSEIV